jgi:NAD(P)-dependent dehydrogenase (short-subunit alcohol dehydrogenase family)
MHHRTVLVTGCSSGIGLATAKLLQAKGWQVYATVRKEEDVERLKAIPVHPVRCDMNDSASIQAAVKQVLASSGGRCDALINNAGYAEPGAIEDIKPAQLQRQFQTNVFGLHELTCALIPVMRAQGHGRIVMISSILGLVSLPYRGAYNASKHALEAMASAMRMELHGSGVRVSVVQPGPIVSRFRDNAHKAFTQAPPEQTAHRQHYQAWQQAHQQASDMPFSLGPEAVAKRCLHALSHTRPRNYYKVTLPCYVLACLHNLLPSACMDALLRYAKW